MLQAQISEIFHYPTALTRDQLSFANANVQDLGFWASQLSIMQLGDTSEAVLKALYEIAELKCSETLRFDLIQALHPLIENILERLEKNFLNQGLFLSDRNKDIIELTTRLRTLFADIYIDIAQRSEMQLKQQKFSILKFAQKRNVKTARLLSSYYALQQLGLLLVQQQMLYRSALSKQWLMTHYLYDLALKNQEHTVNINLLQGTHHALKNIQQCYAQVLLLEIFNTHQIRPSEIYALYQCTADWAQLVQVLPRETALSRYVIDTTKDHPPVYNRKHHESFKPNIFVATQSLLEHVNLTIQKDNEYLSKKEKAYLTAPLKFHVQNVLGSTIERRHERYEHSAQLQLCFSLLTAHYYLSKTKTFSETLRLTPPKSKSEDEFAFTYLNDYPDAYTDKSNKVLDKQARQIHAAQVLDISLNGYRVRWLEEEAPPNLRTGEFILINEGVNSKWKGGVIRWIKQSVKKSYELGLEVIGPDIHPCAAKVYTDRSSFNYHPCLFVQTLKIDAPQHSLILPNLQFFKEQQSIYLRLTDQDIKVELIKTMLITQSFVQFEFELFNDEQQYLIDEFLQHQNIESNRFQDVWEALK
ncbi:GTPase [Acinetobacter sp. YH12239]|uniref:GTPase n=1 Tax=Acinetobacter sp. YH12239 TaxID=2601166 RepID=UPI0015D32345|nr:GTPase [Acinetobacter sp. YH12239]